MVDFFLPLFIAYALRYIGKKFFPLLMPRGRLKPLLYGFLGGVVGGLLARFFLPVGPQIGGIYLVGPVGGTALVYLGWGIAPFFRILAGKS